MMECKGKQTKHKVIQYLVSTQYGSQRGRTIVRRRRSSVHLRAVHYRARLLTISRDPLTQLPLFVIIMSSLYLVVQLFLREFVQTESFTSLFISSEHKICFYPTANNDYLSKFHLTT